ncbi:putative hydrolase [Streptomyces zinciresistens K42]|uniref:Putative hydrolase n=1 Tax=Streptomyces zinciresistens K42 TaxID=700597 RepID=G2G760_9ACTN|nr:putative hydrolase [Streptomyces zinciresistens K42]
MLVVVDVQAGFINEHSRGVVPFVVRLVKAWVALGQPLVLTRFFNPPDSPYEQITGWTGLRSPEEQHIVDELDPFAKAAAAVIDKPGSSAFTQEFSALVRKANWTDIVLAGIDTDACVYDTALAAYHSGVRPWIVTDACASTGGPEYHEAALLLAGRNINRRNLLTTESLLSGKGGPLEGGAA